MSADRAARVDAANLGQRHVVGERANLLAEAREGEREADRCDGATPTTSTSGLQRAEMERPDVDAR